MWSESDTPNRLCFFFYFIFLQIQNIVSEQTGIRIRHYYENDVDLCIYEQYHNTSPLLRLFIVFRIVWPTHSKLMSLYYTDSTRAKQNRPAEEEMKQKNTTKNEK